MNIYVFRNWYLTRQFNPDLNSKPMRTQSEYWVQTKEGRPFLSSISLMSD